LYPVLDKTAKLGDTVPIAQRSLALIDFFFKSRRGARHFDAAMASSSDDDVPLVQRTGAFLLGKPKAVIADSTDGDSPLPSWLENHKSPLKGGPIELSSDSDSGLREVASPAKLMTPSKRRPEAAAAADPDDDSQPGPSQPARPAAQRPATTTAAAAPAAAAAAAGPSSQPKAPARRPAPGGLPGLAPSASHSLPLVLPDKLSQAKVLVELESTDEVHGATDLSGDSGAIGRLLAGAGGVQVDLKGEPRAERNGMECVRRMQGGEGGGRVCARGAGGACSGGRLWAPPPPCALAAAGLGAADCKSAALL
jgi:hypothetical protein